MAVTDVRQPQRGNDPQPSRGNDAGPLRPHADARPPLPHADAGSPLRDADAGPPLPHADAGSPLRDADAGSPQRDAEAVRRFIERFASLLNESGLPPMPARVFVALLAADSSSLTSAQLAERLGVSPAAVSGGVRYLIQVGLVSREGEAGSRRHVYRMPDNVWHEILRLRDRMMMRWADVMREGVDVLGAGTPAGARMAESAMYFDFVSKELPGLVARWEEYKAGHQG